MTLSVSFSLTLAVVFVPRAIIGIFRSQAVNEKQQTTPFTQIKRTSGEERDFAHRPLFLVITDIVILLGNFKKLVLVQTSRQSAFVR